MVSWLALLMTSRPSMYTRAIPLPLKEIRCRPETVGVKVPVQRADQTVGSPAGGVVTFTVGSTRVITGAPLKSGDAKYSALNPGPGPDAGASVAVSMTGGSAAPAVPCADVTSTPSPARAWMPSSGVTVPEGTTVAEPPPV